MAFKAVALNASSVKASPITAEEFAAAMAALAGEVFSFSPAAKVKTNAKKVSPSLAVAVSGGPDSMALCLLAAEYAAARGLRLIAFHVDHGLRSASAREAAQVAAWLTARGIPVRILRWRHGAVASAIQAQARDARYRLLVRAAKRARAAAVLLAHHQDDQAETVLLRLCKGSGVDGLSGMAGERVQDGVRFLRPLLSMPRARLLATCRAQGQKFLQDPSNRNPAYARARLRRVEGLLSAEGLSAESLVLLATRARLAAEALSQQTAKVLPQILSKALEDKAAVILKRAALLKQPDEIALRVLSVALHAVSPQPHPVRFVQRLSLLNAIREKAFRARTLAGVIIRREGVFLSFQPEPPRKKARAARNTLKNKEKSR